MPTTRLPTGGILAAVALIALPAAAPAGFYTYTFTGRVTAVDNAGGFFDAAAAVGAPVTGSVTYPDGPDLGRRFVNPSRTINDYFTGYISANEFNLPGSPPAALALNIGGRPATSLTTDLFNVIVGDGNPTESLYFPAGDSVRLGSRMDERSLLFDQVAVLNADLYQYMFASVVLADPAGAALASQAVPTGGLPLAALTRRFGYVSIDDDDGVTTGFLRFDITAVTPVTPTPAPPALVALAAGAVGLGVWRRVRRR